MKNLLIFCLFAVVFVSGCTTTQKGAGVGSLIGAGAGAIIGHQSDHAEEGALVGAATGAACGALMSDQMATQFCPVCGADYTADVQCCPKDGTEPKFKQN